MEKSYSEEKVAWSSIEKYIPYSKVIWKMRKNGIPIYVFLDEEGKKIDINDVIEND